MSFKNGLIGLSNRTLVEMGRRISPTLATNLAGALARRVKLDPRLNRRQLRDNIRLYFPEASPGWVDATARDVQANLHRAYMLDRWFLPRLPPRQFDALFDVTGWHHVERLVADGRGALVVTLHFGRFWALPIWFTRRGLRTSAFASGEGKMPHKEQILSGHSLGTNDPLSAFRALKSLRGGGFVFLQLDGGKMQHALAVDFLGHPTRVSPSTLELARAAGAAIVPAVASEHPTDRDRIVISCLDTIDMREIPVDTAPETVMRRILEPLEGYVRESPGQWCGLRNAHRRLASATE